MPQTTLPFQPYFDEIIAHTPEKKRAQHHTSFQQFATLGLPKASDEAWKYTRLTPLTKETFSVITPQNRSIRTEDIEAYTISDLPCYRLVWIDGMLSEAHSDIEDLRAQCDIHDEAEPLFYDALSTLNGALSLDKRIIHIPHDTVIDKPIHIISLTSEQAISHPCLVVYANHHSKACFIETHGALGDAQHYWTNPVLRFEIRKNASIEHIKLQQDTATTYHTATTHVTLQDHSTYDHYSLYKGAKIARDTLHTDIKGQHATSRLNGAYLGKDMQINDHYLPVIHHAPHSYSSQTYKSVLDDKAQGIFYGKIAVPPHSIKTSAHQLNHNLVLGEHAKAFSRPELEIETDDVQCSHGSAIGAIDMDALFYMQSRGIPEPLARRLLIEGFLANVFDNITHPPIKSAILQMISSWLEEEVTL